MNRRGFLGSILALGAAPAIVRADSLMRVVPRDLALIEVPDVILMAPHVEKMFHILWVETPCSSNIWLPHRSKDEARNATLRKFRPSGFCG